MKLNLLLRAGLDTKRYLNGGPPRGLLRIVVVLWMLLLLTLSELSHAGTGRLLALNEVHQHALDYLRRVKGTTTPPSVIETAADKTLERAERDAWKGKRTDFVDYHVEKWARERFAESLRNSHSKLEYFGSDAAFFIESRMAASKQRIDADLADFLRSRAELVEDIRILYSSLAPAEREAFDHLLNFRASGDKVSTDTSSTMHRWSVAGRVADALGWKERTARRIVNNQLRPRLAALLEKHEVNSRDVVEVAGVLQDLRRLNNCAELLKRSFRGGAAIVTTETTSTSNTRATPLDFMFKYMIRSFWSAHVIEIMTTAIGTEALNRTIHSFLDTNTRISSSDKQALQRIRRALYTDGQSVNKEGKGSLLDLSRFTRTTATDIAEMSAQLLPELLLNKYRVAVIITDDNRVRSKKPFTSYDAIEADARQRLTTAELHVLDTLYTPTELRAHINGINGMPVQRDRVLLSNVRMAQPKRHMYVRMPDIRARRPNIAGRDITVRVRR